MQMPADELRSENPGEFTADQNGATTFASPAVKENESTRFLPQTLGGVFDESFELYKKHFLTFAMIAAVALIPTQMLLHTIVALWLRPLANQINANSSPDAGLLVLTRIGFFFTGDPRNETPGLISLLVPILISGPMAVAVSDIYIGRKATVRDAYRRARPYLPRL